MLRELDAIMRTYVYTCSYETCMLRTESLSKLVECSGCSVGSLSCEYEKHCVIDVQVKDL